MYSSGNDNLRQFFEYFVLINIFFRIVIYQQNNLFLYN